MPAQGALADFLREAQRTPFAWGRHDCALLVANRVRAVHGLDPAAGWRGRYSTELGCARRLLRAGGLEAVFVRELAAVGLSRTDVPAAGDVGLLRTVTPRGVQPVGAVCAGRRWVMLGDTGLIAADLEPLAAWRV